MVLATILLATDKVATECANASTDQSAFRGSTALMADDSSRNGAANSANSCARSCVRTIGARNCQKCEPSEAHACNVL